MMMRKLLQLISNIHIEPIPFGITEVFQPLDKSVFSVIKNEVNFFLTKRIANAILSQIDPDK